MPQMDIAPACGESGELLIPAPRRPHSLHTYRELAFLK